MSTPRSWDLLLAAKACLERISVANGFYTNAGSTVTLEPGQVPQDAGMAIAAALDLLSAAETDSGRANQAFDKAVLVVVAKVSVQQADAQIRLHELMADVKRCFVGRQREFPAGIRFPQFIEARPIAPADGLSWMGVEVRFSSQIPAHW